MFWNRVLSGDSCIGNFCEISHKDGVVTFSFEGETWTVPADSFTRTMDEKNPYAYDADKDGRCMRWAEFEYSRGNAVTCDADDDHFRYEPGSVPWANRTVPVCCIRSNKWRLA